MKRCSKIKCFTIFCSARAVKPRSRFSSSISRVGKPDERERFPAASWARCHTLSILPRLPRKFKKAGSFSGLFIAPALPSGTGSTERHLSLRARKRKPAFRYTPAPSFERGFCPSPAQPCLGYRTAMRMAGPLRPFDNPGRVCYKENGRPGRLFFHGRDILLPASPPSRGVLSII
jgi:hypothetical protein